MSAPVILRELTALEEAELYLIEPVTTHHAPLKDIAPLRPDIAHSVEDYFADTHASEIEQGRAPCTTYAVQAAIQAALAAVSRTMKDALTTGRRVDDWHAHPHKPSVPCIHCAVETAPISAVERAVIRSLCESQGLSDDWNAKDTRRGYHVAAAIDELPIEHASMFCSVFGEHWFDLLWVSLLMEKLTMAELGRVLARLPEQDDYTELRPTAAWLSGIIVRSSGDNARALRHMLKNRLLIPAQRGLLVDADIF